MTGVNLTAEIWKLSSENIEYINELGKATGNITNKSEYIGGYAYIIHNVSNNYRAGTLLSNIILIDGKLGEIYYMDDNGIADREIP